MYKAVKKLEKKDLTAIKLMFMKMKVVFQEAVSCTAW